MNDKYESTPAQPHHVEAMERAWLWMENQADGQSKGGHATFDLMMLREERDALRTAIDATPSPQAAQQASAHVLHLVQDAFAEVAMAYPKAFALHKVGLADTAVREALAAPATPADSVLEDAAQQPRLTVRLTAFPESNGKQNWTALLVRTDKWDGLVGNCGGISLARGEMWNRVAYAAERARFLIGERDTEPFILDYGDDIKTPEEWKGEIYGGRKPRDAARKQGGA